MFDWQPPKLENPSEDDVAVWTVAIGNFPLPIFMSKKVKVVIQFIREQEGFVGFYPCYPHGTLCLFKTENQAKIARNMMHGRDIKTGDNICQVYINREFF